MVHCPFPSNFSILYRSNACKAESISDHFRKIFFEKIIHCGKFNR